MSQREKDKKRERKESLIQRAPFKSYRHHHPRSALTPATLCNAEWKGICGAARRGEGHAANPRWRRVYCLVDIVFICRCLELGSRSRERRCEAWSDTCPDGPYRPGRYISLHKAPGRGEFQGCAQRGGVYKAYD